MADEWDPLTKQGRSKEEQGRFTLTPAERKLARQTLIAGQNIERDIPSKEKDPDEGLPGSSIQSPFERKGEPASSNYARGGPVLNSVSSRKKRRR